MPEPIRPPEGVVTPQVSPSASSFDWVDNPVARAGSNIVSSTLLSVFHSVARPQYGIGGAALGYYANKYFDTKSPYLFTIAGALVGGYAAYKNNPIRFGSW